MDRGGRQSGEGLEDSGAAATVISVLILTRNEERNLLRCLESVKWSDDVLVLDSYSTDRTVEIAKSAGARVIQRTFDDFAGQRNFGLRDGCLRHEWVLHLDADEVVTRALSDELRQVGQSGERDAYRLASRLMFRGTWLRHAGMYPTYQVRFGRKDCLSFVQVGHGQRETTPLERVGTLAQPLLHYSYSKGLDDWFARHNRYAAAEARQAFRERDERLLNWRGLFAGDPVRKRRALKQLASRMPFRPTLRFMYMYVLRGGWRDGAAGFTYCRLLALYEYMIVLKLRELHDLERGLQL
jgi:glycosyltransferase involved in cell wall biosynthesis